MKTLKYRSLFSKVAVVVFSAMLFSACEKDNEGNSPKQLNKERIEKFKRLIYTATTTGNTSNGGYVTFSGNGSSVNFSRAGGGSNTYTGPTRGNSNFTDPSSTAYNFRINQSLTEGGGTVKLGRTTYDLDFGFCAEADFFGNFDDSDSTEDSSLELDLFVGIAGDFDAASIDGGDSELGLDLILYTFSYNGSTKIGDFDDFNEEELNNLAFVLAIEFKDDSEKVYFATEGSVNFSGSEVLLTSVKMKEIEDDELSEDLVNLTANLECVQSGF